MIFFTFLCYLSVSTLMVSPNPILQPCQLYQNEPLQASDYHLYQPIDTVQNCLSPYCEIDDVNSNLVNQLLSNPTIQLILDPNTRLINQDGVEVSRQPQNGQQQAVVNNYIIIPPEVFNNGTKGSKKTVRNNRRNKNNDTRTNTSNANNSTNVQTNGNNLNTTNPIKTLTEALMNTIPSLTEVNNGTSRTNKRRLRNRKRIKNNRRTNEGNNVTQSVNENSNNNTNLVNNDLIINNSLIQNYTSDFNNNLKISNFKNYELAMKAYTTSKPNKNDLFNDTESNNFSLINQTYNMEPVNNSTKSDNTENLKINNNTTNIMPKEIFVTILNTDPKEEAIVKDLHNKYPEIPENLLQNIISNLKEQLTNKKASNNKNQTTNRKSKRRRNGSNRRRKNGDRSRKITNENVKKEINKNTASESNKTNEESETKMITNTNNRFEPIIYIPSNPKMMENVPKSLKFFLESLKNKSKIDTKPVTEKTADTSTEKPELAVDPPLRTTETYKNESNIDTIPTTEKAADISSEKPKLAIEPALETTEKIIDYSYEEVSTETAKVENISYIKMSSDEALNFIETSTFIPLKPKLNVDDFSPENDFPALGNEDVVPVMELNDIIDEYYPDFTKDAIAYLESAEELNNNHKITDFAARHYYTTDKNYEINEYYSKTPHLSEDNDINLNKHLVISKSSDYEDTVSKPISKSEQESEELDFKSPPLLDSPDFQTRAINKNTYRRDESYNYDKGSTYSDIKAAQFNYDEKSNIKNTETKDVETHYAKSKVVKYGQSGRFSHDDLDGIFDGSEDDTALVFATPFEY